MQIKKTIDDLCRAEMKRVSDLLHPTGRCTCSGEGACEWCQLICQICFGDSDGCPDCKGTGWANGVYPPGADGKS